MGDYSDAVLEKITDKVSAWTDGFEKSPVYDGLSTIQKKETRFITSAFARLMYEYFLETPEKWSTGALRECCLDLFPRKLTTGPEFYESVEPVLTAFFTYLQKEDHITNAAELTSQLKKVAGNMIERASRPENWGIAKTLAMKALGEGVDITDEAAFSRYIEEYNRRISGDEGGANRPKKVGRNDPCPCGSGKKYKKCCGVQGNIVAFPGRPSSTGSTSSANDIGSAPVKPDGAAGATVYQLKITIREIEPPIWRRLLVPQGITFSKLHKIIQAAFGWQDYHLYSFDFGDTVISLPDPDYGPGELYGGAQELNARKTRIDELLQARRTCVYTYDFGDNWQHDVVLEAVLPKEEGQRYLVCIGGARQRPPEDVGGVGGYEDFLQAIADPENPEHDEYLLWAEKDTGGMKFDPEYFYLPGVNRALAKIRYRPNGLHDPHHNSLAI